MWATLFGSWRLLAVAALLGFCAGSVATWQLRSLAHNAQLARALKAQEERTAEQQRIAVQAERDSLTATQARLKRAEGIANDLRKRLSSVPECVVPRDVVRLFNDSTMPAAPGAAASIDAAARSDEAAQCRELLAVCVSNQSGACAENEERVRQWQDFYRELRRAR